jgi:threonylcarbamoyladenosine tRNA methylthiotransferase MtaB
MLSSRGSIKVAKVSFYTVGCKLNQYDTELISKKLAKLGFERVDWADDADLYIINSCNVTHKAAADSRRKLFAAKRKSPNSKVIITGCYAQIQPELLASLKDVDFVIQNDEKDQLITKLVQVFPDIQADNLKNDDNTVDAHYKHSRALIKIQDGCNQKCSYCVVPLGRGAESSRPANEIIKEIKSVQCNNYKEIVLTGVHIGRYRENCSVLSTLISRILDETEVERIRLSSIEVNEIDEDLIKCAESKSRICPHFHIPLQSGSDRILKWMNRPYKISHYLEKIEELKNRVNNVMIGADIIVGFPGESNSDFTETMTVIENSAIDYLHVFSYSDHPQARSYQMEDKVHTQEIKSRNKMLTTLGRLKWKNFLNSQLQRKLPVLLEKRYTKDSLMLTGLSDNYIRVECEGTDKLFNSIQKITPVSISGSKLIGKIESL